MRAIRTAFAVAIPAVVVALAPVLAQQAPQALAAAFRASPARTAGPRRSRPNPLVPPRSSSAPSRSSASGAAARWSARRAWRQRRETRRCARRARDGGRPYHDRGSRRRRRARRRRAACGGAIRRARDRGPLHRDDPQPERQPRAVAHRSDPQITGSTPGSTSSTRDAFTSRGGEPTHLILRVDREMLDAAPRFQYAGRGSATGPDPVAAPGSPGMKSPPPATPPQGGQPRPQ